MKRVGHKGADLLVAGNTLESFAAAVEVGVHMIEFDILPEKGTGRLIAAHDYGDAAGRSCLTAEQCLDYFIDRPDLEIDIDLKLPGYELDVLKAIADRGLQDRVIVSSTFKQSLEVIRSHNPAISLGWSVPRASRDYTRSPFLALPALLGLRAVRTFFPSLAVRYIESGGCDAIMAYWRMVTPGLVRRVQAAGGEVYAWTVDSPKLIRRFEAMGVDGVITNDPRLFHGN